MKITLSPQHQDILLLKWPVLLLVLALLASAVWCGIAYQFRQSSYKALQTARTKRAQMETKVLQIKDQAETINSFIGRYRQLTTEGVIGDEDRLELVETIGRIRARHNLYPVQLDIEPQATLPLRQEGVASGGGIAMKASRIQIAIPLLHEEDLSRLLDGLQGMKRGIFVVEACLVRRTGNDSGNAPPVLHENLTASCKILWLTVKQEEAEAAKDSLNQRPEPGKP